MIELNSSPLREFMERKSFSRKDMSNFCGVPDEVVESILSGKGDFCAVYLLKIRQATKIKCDDILSLHTFKNQSFSN